MGVFLPLLSYIVCTSVLTGTNVHTNIDIGKGQNSILKYFFENLTNRCKFVL